MIISTTTTTQSVTKKQKKKIGITFPDGNIQYKIALITDQDKYSKDNERNNTWKSFLLTGKLYFNPQSLNTTIIWNNQSKVLYSQLNFDGKAMELSAMTVFDNYLVTVDDRTGIVHKIVNNFTSLVPWVILNNGPGSSKQFKGEWMTIKDDCLVVGGLGFGNV
uniref:Uncharacterized protein n=1 Tax=Meloidogyne enterolobii TaxID=390850 RepID=A0A6V7WUN4_MELEN|nr:unnamed protein product [Meloidogyne enterolobii]